MVTGGVNKTDGDMAPSNINSYGFSNTSHYNNLYFYLPDKCHSHVATSRYRLHYTLTFTNTSMYHGYLRTKQTLNVLFSKDTLSDSLPAGSLIEAAAKR